MEATILVDLHCHSIHSDGVLTPQQVAEALASAGVKVASLTDHDTVDGLPSFRDALARKGIAYVPGVEITCQHRDQEVHILGYGIDQESSELRSVLQSIRQTKTPHDHSIAGSLRNRGLSVERTETDAPHSNGSLSIQDCIAMVHRAGGKAFLAHPLFVSEDMEQLSDVVVEFQEMGLDGIEAYYQAFSDQQCQDLAELAKRHSLLVSGGTDLHDSRGPSKLATGIEMPVERWKAFRDSLYAGKPDSVRVVSPKPAQPNRKKSWWRNFIFHFVFPTALAISLFFIAIYALFLPSFERSLMDRKREMIKELTNSAWSILNAYEKDAAAGRMTRSQAQQLAKSRIEILRYGREGKDYFWIQDTKPVMIMHPYRTDLNGKDVSGFTDPRGRRIFGEFADLVKRGKEGYVEYVWQWKDDPKKLVPKESYIKGFQPWGWIIGTGIYVEDVKQEISQIERDLRRTSLGISAILILLLFYVMRQSLRLERQRAEAEDSLYESTHRYRSLVEATTEGTVLVAGGICRYANPTFLEMIKCRVDELELLDLADLFPHGEDNAKAWANLDKLVKGEEPQEAFDAVIQTRDGRSLDCVVSTSRMSFADQNEFILLVRDVSVGGLIDEEDDREVLAGVAAKSPVGLFRVRANSRGTILGANETARKLLGIASNTDSQMLALSELLPGAQGYESMWSELQHRSSVRRQIEVGSRSDAKLSIELHLIKDESGNPIYVDGIVQDVRSQSAAQDGLQAVTDRLYRSTSTMYQLVQDVCSQPVFCSYRSSIRSATQTMADKGVSAALVQAESGETIGIVTDSDIRLRAIAAGLSLNEPISKIMTAPVATIANQAEVYEALLLMESKQIRHLAVVDTAGSAVGMLDGNDLLRFRDFSEGVLEYQIAQAETMDSVARLCGQVPSLIQSALHTDPSVDQATKRASAACDAAMSRLIELKTAELGPAPVEFAFIALGSHGRQELNLASDQDNALIYADSEDAEDQKRVHEYMTELGKSVCQGLAAAGYPRCSGGIMADNPKWCQPLSAWKRQFRDWIDLPEPQQLLEFAVFFDFRLVKGSSGLVDQLREHIFAQLKKSPSFYPHFAQNALLFKPPARILGKVAGDSAGNIDLKAAMMPIVSFARLYALHNQVHASHTVRRLSDLRQLGVVSDSSFEDMASAYELLMRMRMKKQARSLLEGDLPSNWLNVHELGPEDQQRIVSAFNAIAAVQKRISFDFLGGT